MVFKRNNVKTSIVLIMVLGAIDTAWTAQPTMIPENIIKQVGTVASFNCTAVYDQPVYFATRPYGSTTTRNIYIGEKLLVNYYGTSGRFSIEVNNTMRRHSLIINDTQQTDGGSYICIDERGLGKKAYAELVVWDKLICQEDEIQDSYMGDNVFGLDQDVIRFTCRLNYTGNIRPQLKWSVGGRNMKGTQGTESGIVSSSLTLAAMSKFNGANVTCEAVIRNLSEARTGVLWTSDPIRVKYAVLKQAVVKECPGVERTLDCNPPCSFQLEIVNGTQHCAMNYSAGTDDKWFHFYESGAHCCESGWSQWAIVMTVLLVISCSGCALSIGLLIRLLKMNPSSDEKDKSTNDESIPMNATATQDPADPRAERKKKSPKTRRKK